MFSLIAVLPSGCGDDSRATGQQDPLMVHVVLPEFPFEENPALTINPGLLDHLAYTFIDEGGTIEEVPRFLFSFVPHEAFNQIGGKDLCRLEDLEGLMYLSGFFGGVWLKGVLRPDPLYIDTALIQVSGYSGHMELFSFLASVTKNLNDRARYADEASLQQFILSSMDPFIALYGYNRGYMQRILERPPQGATPPPGYLVCPHFVDCRTPLKGFFLLEDLLPVAENLIEPPDDRWESMKAKVEQQGPPAFTMGYQVWSRFLSTEGMKPQAYLQLLDLSAGFLAYCQILVLSGMDAWVQEDEEMGRMTVALSAGMMAWAGGYMLGLASDYPGDHLPWIELIH